MGPEQGLDESEKTLDVQGLKCPLPVLKTRKAIKEVAIGGYLKVIATDPLAELDIRHFCEESGHILERQQQDADVLTFLIRRSA